MNGLVTSHCLHKLDDAMAEGTADAVALLVEHLTSEYHEIKRADLVLQDHRTKWLAHVERWMDQHEKVQQHLMPSLPPTPRIASVKEQPPTSLSNAALPATSLKDADSGPAWLLDTRGLSAELPEMQPNAISGPTFPPSPDTLSGIHGYSMGKMWTAQRMEPVTWQPSVETNCDASLRPPSTPDAAPRTLEKNATFGVQCAGPERPVALKCWSDWTNRPEFEEVNDSFDAVAGVRKSESVAVEATSSTPVMDSVSFEKQKGGVPAVLDSLVATDAEALLSLSHAEKRNLRGLGQPTNALADRFPEEPELTPRCIVADIGSSALEEGKPSLGGTSNSVLAGGKRVDCRQLGNGCCSEEGIAYHDTVDAEEVDLQPALPDTNLYFDNEQESRRRSWAGIDRATPVKEEDDDLDKPIYDVADFYWSTGPSQAVARSDWFANVTLAVISLNAVYIGVEADRNDAENIVDADVSFQVCENIFCSLFFSEWAVRFFAFRNKVNCLRDTWFKFDTALMMLMVFETWVTPLFFGGVGHGLPTGIVKLLRLLRLARTVRLMRAFPELVAMIKGVREASRAVGSALMMVLLLIYIFAIVMHMLMEPFLSADFVLEERFKTVPMCMWTLFLDGTLLDGVSITTRALYKNDAFAAFFILPFSLPLKLAKRWAREAAARTALR